MATTNSGSGGDQTPSSSQAPKKSVDQQSSSSSSIPLSGDGKTPQKAAWSPSLTLAPNTKKTYVVDGLGLVPRFRRTTLIEARSAAQSYTVLDGDTYQVVPHLPPGLMANPTTPVMTDVPQQLAGVVAHENVMAAGSGPVAQQYHSAQAHHGDALAESDNDNTGNSSDEAVDDSSSSPSSASGSHGTSSTS